MLVTGLLSCFDSPRECCSLNLLAFVCLQTSGRNVKCICSGLSDCGCRQNKDVIKACKSPFCSCFNNISIFICKCPCCGNFRYYCTFVVLYADTLYLCYIFRILRCGEQTCCNSKCLRSLGLSSLTYFLKNPFCSLIIWSIAERIIDAANLFNLEIVATVHNVIFTITGIYKFKSALCSIVPCINVPSTAYDVVTSLGYEVYIAITGILDSELLVARLLVKCYNLY